MNVTFTSVVPILRIFDLDKARQFYVDYLGFTVDWEHRSSESAPLYLQVSRGLLVLHLSEHHGDGTPGSAVYVETMDVRALHAELRSKAYPYLNPGIGVDEIGTCMTLLDPFGNTLRFNEPPSGTKMDEDLRGPRLATPDDAFEVARLLHDFNTEFDTPSPGVDVLADRLRVLLAGDETMAILAGKPAVAVALVTLRPNVWYAGPVALLDELYVVPDRRSRGIGTAVVGQLLTIARARGVALVEINVDEGDVDAQRFYERHGFSPTQEGSTERALYFTLEL